VNGGAIPDSTDVLIIGAGIAGLSAAHALATGDRRHRVVVIEREDQPGYHATGRSAALFTEAYGHPVIRALSRASRGFLASPPDGFIDNPLLTPCGVLHVGRADQREAVERLFVECQAFVKALDYLDESTARSLQPVLRPGFASAAVYEPDALDMDVDGLLQGYARGLRTAGGSLVTGAPVTAIERQGDHWRVETPRGTIRADAVVNAAGAWADHAASLAGARPLGLQPLRRTAILFDAPAEAEPSRWPMTLDVDETFYFKPEAGRLLASPADETPVPPGDVQAEEWDVAVAADRVQAATTLTIQSITHRWAGLRTFAPDRVPVVGADPDLPSFYWLAGQGGYGIMTAPAMARVAATVVGGDPLPGDLADHGVTLEALSPARFSRT